VGYRVLRAVIRGLLRAIWGLHVEGLEHLPRQGPYVLAPNHPSEIDPIILGAALPLRPTYLASRHLQAMPVVYWLIRRLGDPVWVRRELGDHNAIKECLARLEAGEVLVIFPEGKVVQEKDLGHLYAGAAFLAIRGHVPVVPVGLVGVAEMLPLGVRWPHRARIGVRVGHLLHPSDREHVADLTHEIGDALRGLVK